MSSSVDASALRPRHARRRVPSQASAPAFTLIELLVVIGIIAILVAILIPALAGARRQAQLTQCLSTLRQAAAGAMLHATNHRGYYPLAGDFAGLPTSYTVSGAPPHDLNDASRHRYTYLDLEERFFRGVTLAPWHAAVAVQFGKRSAIEGKNNVEILEDEIGFRNYLKYFLCPAHSTSAAEIPNALIYSAGNLVWMLQQSYVVNEAVFGVNDELGRYRGKASRVRQAAATVMIADGLQSEEREMSWDGGTINWVTLVNKAPTPPITLADALLDNDKAGNAENFDRLRHRGRINMAFFDGHAETRQITPRDLNDVYLLAR